MKRSGVKMGMLVAGAVLLTLCGCAAKQEVPSQEAVQTQKAQEMTQPTPEEIGNAAVAAGNFYAGWFWVNEHTVIDMLNSDWDAETGKITYPDAAEGDVIYAEYEGTDEWPFVKVKQEELGSISELVEMAKQYYTEEAAQQIVKDETASWIEQDGAVYVPTPEIGDPVEPDKLEIAVKPTSETEYEVTIYGIFEEADEDNYEESVNYRYENGHFGFSKKLFFVTKYEWGKTMQEHKNA